jgi:hypothetical protein
MKVSDEQIEMLARALRDNQSEAAAIPYPIEEGETRDFYLGMVNGLVLGHQFLLDCETQDPRLARLFSVAAALASQFYLERKKAEADEVLMTDHLTTD